MKSKHPQDWQIILFGAIMFFLCLQSCTTTKNVQKSEVKTESESKSTEEAKSTAQIETNTQTKAETVTNEQCDTNIWVMVPVSATKKDTIIKVQIPVKFQRIIKRIEASDQNKKEQNSAQVNKNDQLHQKSYEQRMDKTVERTGLPWWAIAILTIFILIGVAELLWRLKVF